MTTTSMFDEPSISPVTFNNLMSSVVIIGCKASNNTVPDFIRSPAVICPADEK